MCRNLFLVGVVVLVAGSAAPRLATAAEPGKRTVSVSAIAQVKVVPDEVVLSVGITTQDKDSLTAAKAANDQRTRAVLALAEKYRLAADQVQVAAMHMGPCTDRNCRYIPPFDGSFSEPGRKPKYEHYHVSREIEVVLRDFNAIDRFVSDVLAADATSVGELLFRTTKNPEHQVEARRRAVEYAKVKASHLAELNGLRLGKAVEIEEDVEMNRHTVGAGMGGMGGSMGFTSAKIPKHWSPIRLTAAGFKDTDAPQSKKEVPVAKQPIAVGMITIDATVRIVFELLD